MYDRRAIGLVLACAFLLARPADPASSRLAYRFQRIGPEQGLSQESVQTIAQDRRGFIWVGTQSGLNRYDGYEFIVYRHHAADPSSLADSWVNVIHSDSRGRLWIGTRAGLQRLEPETDIFVALRPGPADAGRVGAQDVRAIAEDGNGGLWVGTTDGLARVDPDSGRFQYWRPGAGDPHALSSPRIAALARDRSGQLWVATPAGLDRLRPDGKGFDHFRVDPASPAGTGRNSVAALGVDASGAIWIGTTDGLERWSPDASQRRRFGAAEGLPAGPVRAIHQDASGGVWVSVYEEGIARWDAAAGRFFRYRHDDVDRHSITSDLVTSIFQDRSGALWVGAWVGGLSHTDLAGGGFDRVVHRADDPSSLSDNITSTIFGDSKGRIWIGTRTGGLNRLDRATGRVTVFRNDPRDPRSIAGDFVEALMEDPSGKLWVGTDQGLDLFDPEAGTFQHVRHEWPSAYAGAPAEVRVMLRDAEGAFWIGTGNGLNRFDPVKNTAEWYGPEPGNPHSLGYAGITSLLRDRAGTIWIGTFGGGLDRLDRHEGGTATFSHFRHEAADRSSLSHDRVYCLFEDRRGVLWVGTAEGLNRVERGPDGRLSFVHYDTRSGLPDNAIYAITEDRQGHLWVGTENGLGRLDPARRPLRNYTAADGVIDATTLGSVFAHEDGTLFFGGFEGVTVFRPEDLRDNPFPPQVAVTDFLVVNKSVKLGAPAGFRMEGGLEQASAVTLSHRHNVFAIEFAALHFGDPGRNRYEYMLEGFDEDWVATDATHRLATYTNLDPGSYVFRVRAASKDGVWNEDGIRLVLAITPPFWKTWWFRGAAAVLLIGALYGAYRGRVRQLAGQRDRLERQVAERTAELQRAYQALEEVSLTDPLTGLHNRRFLLQQMDGDVAVTLRRYGVWLRERSGPPPTHADLVFFMVDIDHFKAVNDGYGHGAGDRVLIQMRERLRGVFRISDHIVRWGGEEFLVVARLKREDAPAVAERIRSAVAERPFDIGEAVGLTRTCSVGFACFPFCAEQPRALTWTQVVGLADQALYAAKRAGRDAWVGLYATERTPAAEVYDALTQNLADAVRGGTLRVATPLPPGTIADALSP